MHSSNKNQIPALSKSIQEAMLLFSSGLRFQNYRSMLLLRAVCVDSVQLVHFLPDLLDLLLGLPVLFLYLFDCQPALAFVKAQTISRRRMPRIRKQRGPELVHFQGRALNSEVTSWIAALSFLFLELPVQGSFDRLILILYRLVVDCVIGIKPLEVFLCIIDVAPQLPISRGLECYL